LGHRQVWGLLCAKNDRMRKGMRSGVGLEFGIVMTRKTKKGSGVESESELEAQKTRMMRKGSGVESEFGPVKMRMT